MSTFIDPPLNQDPIERGTVRWTRPWYQWFQLIQQALKTTGTVNGPTSSTNNAIARWDGTAGDTLQDSGITIADGATGTLSGSNSGDVTLAGTPNYLTILGQVITRSLINLASHVTGRLPFANLTAATVQSVLLGRRAGSAGDFEEIAVGSGLAMTGSTLSATAGGGGTVTSVATDDTYVSGGPIVGAGTISATVLSKAAIDGANALYGGI